MYLGLVRPFTASAGRVCDFAVENHPKNLANSEKFDPFLESSGWLPNCPHAGEHE
jgi:hypothetical protein